jgi:hypothetical protein
VNGYIRNTPRHERRPDAAQFHALKSSAAESFGILIRPDKSGQGEEKQRSECYESLIRHR